MYLVALVIYFFFRCLLWGVNFTELQELITQENQFGLVLKSFWIGWRFDTVIACYILALPLLILLITTFLKHTSIRVFKAVHGFTLVLFSISFIISASDIQYFQQFFTRFNIGAFAWMDSPAFVFKMIAQDPTNLLYLALLVIILFFYIKIANRIFKKYIVNPSEKKEISLYLKTITSLVLVGLCFFGIRGRFASKSPIRVGTAYISSYPIINQLGLNPTFTFIKSYEESKKNKKHEIQLTDPEKAAEFVQSEFEWMYQNPIAERQTILDANTNIVLVLMESMGTVNMASFNGKGLTPNLDQIGEKSVSYTQVYTAGIHTYNGVYSTLFGRPAFLGKHSMNTTNIPTLAGGLPLVLKNRGYQTYYYTTHDDQFDNIGGFLSANSVDHIIAQKDYPSSQIESSLGVPDHVMFDRLISDLNQRNSQKPFFTTVLTSSNHMPYVIPDGIDFTSKSKDIKDQIVEYSDWAIGEFLKKASQTKWFENTLFVFIADHGAYLGKTPYEMPISYHHTPMFFYHPKKLQPKKDSSIGLQIDTPAMIYSYLGMEDKNTMGVAFDLYPRKFAYFSADDKIGVWDQEHFYVWNKNGQEFLYRNKTGKNTNYIQEDSAKAQQMKQYGFSMIMNSVKSL